jgi:hypothetical protein
MTESRKWEAPRLQRLVARGAQTGAAAKIDDGKVNKS